MGKIKTALAWAFGFIGEEKFYKGFAFIITLAVKWAVKRKRYDWLRNLSKRIVKFCTSIINATEDDVVDEDELRIIVSAGQDLVRGDSTGDMTIHSLIAKQEEDGEEEAKA